MNAEVKHLSKEGQRTLWFGLGALVWAMVIINVPMIVRQVMESAGGDPTPFPPVLGLLMIAVEAGLAITGVVFGVKALRKGERSGLFWLGFIIAVLVCILITMFILGEIFIEH